MPFFSIIIPTYNRANLIAATLQTVLQQDFADYEVLVIDDGSTDDTPQVIQTLFGHHEKLRYLRKNNEERSIARNYGLQQAKGEFAVFFDSDDFMHPDHLSSLYEAIQKHPNFNFFACKHDFNNNGKIYYNATKNIAEGIYDYHILLNHGSLFGTLVCVRINNPKLKLFPPEFNILEDWVFNMLNLREDKIYLIDKFTMTVNDHPNRTVQNNQKAIQARIAVTDYILNTIQLPNNEIHILKGKGYEFCAIHSYLDNNRSEAIKYLKLAINELGISSDKILLLIKILIGKKNINLFTKKQ
jgi:GalNAc5-diNAcBac-PP-undecaprenol beta-1,3-glucosyltransferase